MSVTPSSTVVGIFRDRSMAEQAANALSDAGFEREQIHYSIPGNSGGFLEDLKSLFTGTSSDGSNLANDLTDLGLSNEEVQHYSNEYNNGNTILAVRAAGREQEAQGILHQYGANNAGMEPGFFKETTDEAQQPSTSTWQDNYPASEQQGSTQNWDASPQPRTTEERPLEDGQQEMVTPQSEIEYPPTPPVTPGYNSEVGNTQTGANVPESDADYQSEQPATAISQDDAEQQAPQANVVTSGQEVETPASQASVAAPEHGAEYQTAYPEGEIPERDTGYQVSQASVAVPEQEAEIPTSQPGVVSTEPANELQQLLAEIQATKQRLQEAKAQLQAAKEQEAQLKTVREREQLQAAQQQLQEAQTELQATLAELRETQARLGQYQ